MARFAPPAKKAAPAPMREGMFRGLDGVAATRTSDHRGAGPRGAARGPSLPPSLSLSGPAPLQPAPRTPEGPDGMRQALRRTFGDRDGMLPTFAQRRLPDSVEGMTQGKTSFLPAAALAPGATAEIRRLLGHEAAHAIQQHRGGGSGTLSAARRSALEHEAEAAGEAFAAGRPFTVTERGPASAALFREPEQRRRTRVKQVILFVAEDRVVVVTESARIPLATVYNGHPNPGRYTVRRIDDDRWAHGAGGTGNDEGKIIVFRPPRGEATFDGVDVYELIVVPDQDAPDKGIAREGIGAGEGADRVSRGPREDAGAGRAAGGDRESVAAGAGAGAGRASGGVSETKQGPTARPSTEAQTTGTPGGTKTVDVSGLPPAAFKIARRLAGTGPVQDPRELARLFALLREFIEDPQFTEKGRNPWLTFARFLEKNASEIEGMLRAKTGGQLTQEIIEKIIEQYGKFVAAEPPEEEIPEDPKTPQDFDKLFKTFANWQAMSKADRELMIEFAKRNPEDLRGKPLDFDRVTTPMKVSMALKLSTSWAKEVAETAKAAFSDPGFVLMLILLIGIYVGLWLTPDPSMVTKIAAGTLTAFMLLQFGWNDIYETAVAWRELEEECAAATTVKQLEIAGNKFAVKAGEVGFDILMFIAMWGLGKAAGPKLRKIGAERGVKAAEAKVQKAEAKAGSKVPQKAVGEAAKVFDQATKTAKGPTQTEVLDALEPLLKTPEAKAGLKAFRAELGDAKAFNALESTARRGLDVARHVTEFGLGPKAVAEAKADVFKARAQLARAKFIDMQTLSDPVLRKAARVELLTRVKMLLADMGIMKDPTIKKLADAGAFNELVSALGEAIGRKLLRQKVSQNPKLAGTRQLSNLEVVERIKGFKTIADWVRAEKLAGREGNPKKIRVGDGEIWESLGEVDAMEAKPTKAGKLEPVEIAEVKTGRTDTHNTALDQLNKTVSGLQRIAAGDPEVHIFERGTLPKLGARLTSLFDLTNLSQLTKTTVGEPGRGFDLSLEFPRAILLEVARSLIKPGLPPAGPQTPVPPTRPRDREDEGDNDR